MRLTRTVRQLMAPLGVALLVLGCGGGGGGSSTPALTLTPLSIKTFSFSWPDASAETEYLLREDPNGSSGYTTIATLPANTTSYDHPVFLPARINASYILRTCTGTACTDSAPVLVSGSLAAAVGYVKASNTGFGDELGYSVALSEDGSTLAVGAPYEDSSDNSFLDSGAVYVYTRSGSTWSQQAYVKASNTGIGDRFGWSVALAANGSTLAVGAPLEDSNASIINGNQADNSSVDSGAAYVFTRSGTAWSQQAYVKASNSGFGDQFGYRVALGGAAGDTLAVGAPFEDSNAIVINGNETDNSSVDSGAAYVFTRSGSTWSQQAYVKASNTGTSDRFGSGLALAADGNTLAVGAPFEDSNATGIGGNQANEAGQDSGAVYVFVLSGTWSQQAYVKASNTGFYDQFGYSVALGGATGDTLAVGAPFEDSSASGINGSEADDYSASDSGAVYVFSRSSGSWSQQAYVKASNTGFGDQFGFSVALGGVAGNTLAVGAPYEDGSTTGIGGNQIDESGSNSGAAYVFSFDGSDWSQQAYVKATNTGFDDSYGAGVALAADGASLAVRASLEDSAATGIGGNQADNSASNSGAVYLY